MVEVVRRADLSDVATSHNVDLRKWVLAAAGKYQEGKMTSLKSVTIDKHGQRMSTAGAEIILIVQSEGESVILHADREIHVFRHDLVTVPSRSDFSIRSVTDSPSVFYLLNWEIASQHLKNSCLHYSSPKGKNWS
jgi:hypothetical protein